MKKVAVLGSTGSIGTQTLDIINANRDRFSVAVLSCGSKINLLREQIREFDPEAVCVAKSADAQIIKEEFPSITALQGEQGLIDAATWDCDIVLNALMGISGLAPTYHAIRAGKDIALANKETLVAGGELIISEVQKQGVKMLPVDSEHSAIFQCLEGNRDKKIKKILLTASGGPFRGYTQEQLKEVTLDQALNHPRWTMGPKITIDSATMMNKGLEVIEARWLFNVAAEDIEILVHPQSIVHSAVEFEDTSILAQLGLPDMRIPISVALGYPERLAYSGESLDFFTKASSLTFEKPDPEVFKCLDIAKTALKMGGSYTVCMNGANEVLVDLFLKRKIEFRDIQDYLQRILDAHSPVYNPGLEEILEIDRKTREYTLEIVDKENLFCGIS